MEDLNLHYRGETKTKNLQICRKDLKLDFLAVSEPKFPEICPEELGVNTTEDKAVVVKSCPELSITVYQALGLQFEKCMYCFCDLKVELIFSSFCELLCTSAYVHL